MHYHNSEWPTPPHGTQGRQKRQHAKFVLSRASKIIYFLCPSSAKTFACFFFSSGLPFCPGCDTLCQNRCRQCPHCDSRKKSAKPQSHKSEGCARPLTFRSSSVNTRTEFGLMRAPRWELPYARSAGRYNSHFEPSDISCIASVQPRTTWLGAKEVG